MHSNVKMTFMIEMTKNKLTCNGFFINKITFKKINYFNKFKEIKLINHNFILSCFRRAKTKQQINRYMKRIKNEPQKDTNNVLTVIFTTPVNNPAY